MRLAGASAVDDRRSTRSIGAGARWVRRRSRWGDPHRPSGSRRSMRERTARAWTSSSAPGRRAAEEGVTLVRDGGAVVAGTTLRRAETDQRAPGTSTEASGNPRLLGSEARHFAGAGRISDIRGHSVLRSGPPIRLRRSDALATPRPWPTGRWSTPGETGTLSLSVLNIRHTKIIATVGPASSSPTCCMRSSSRGRLPAELLARHARVACRDLRPIARSPRAEPARRHHGTAVRRSYRTANGDPLMLKEAGHHTQAELPGDPSPPIRIFTRTRSS